MKTSLAIILPLAFALLTITSHAQEKTTDTKRQAPRLRITPEDVIRTKVVPCGERQIIFQKIKPLSLPPIPEPEPREPMTEDQIEAIQQAIPEEIRNRQFLFLGATTYLKKDGNYCSRLRYWINRKSEPVELWVNANFLWIGGMADFRQGDQLYSMLLASSLTDVRQQEELARLARSKWRIPLPDFPEFPDDDVASYIIIEGSPSKEDLRPIVALLKLYNEQWPQLETGFEARRAIAEQKRLERLADPPERKNIVVRHWRLDKVTPYSKPATIK